MDMKFEMLLGRCWAAFTLLFMLSEDLLKALSSLPALYNAIVGKFRRFFLTLEYWSAWLAS